MKNFVILYWEPGSCGDFVQSILLSDVARYSGVIEQFESTTQGRVSPKFNTVFQQLDHKHRLWYKRTWTEQDCEYIKQHISQDTHFIIPTHCLDQVQKLQSYLSDCKTVGITYPKNLKFLVIKNWCKKVAYTDHRIINIYNKPVHENFRQKGIFGEFVLKEQLEFGSMISPKVDYSFDICIPLEDIYAGDLTVVKSLVSEQVDVDSKFKNWISQQNVLYQYDYDLNTNLKQALGFNSKATTQSGLDVKLDLFDNIIIQHFCKQINVTAHNFQTLLDANNFFNTEVTT
jgi:hypothetical protein